MARLLKKGDQGPEVREVQTLLTEKGYLTNEEINGVFDNETVRAVRLIQSQNLDRHGQPLTVDGGSQVHFCAARTCSSEHELLRSQTSGFHAIPRRYRK